MSSLITVGLTLLLILEGLAILALARAIGILQIRLGPEPRALQSGEGLPLYAKAPAVSGYDITIGRLRELTFDRGRHALVFVDAGCGPCRDIVRAAGLVAADNSYDVLLVIVARGSNEQNELLRRLSPRLMLLSDPSGDQQRAYGVESTPFAFVIEDAVIQSKGVVNHRDDLEILVESATSTHGKPQEASRALANDAQIKLPIVKGV